ncbi:MAG TPA: hypothetical protein VI451_19210 [Anaerolineales bacterium]|nr:hypothetical protein [Anaerolineales bacterium]
MSDQSGWNFYPPNPTWPRLKEVLKAAFLRIGGDANLGRGILPLLRETGLTDTKIRAATLAIPGGHPYMRMPLIGAMGFRETILKDGLMTETEFEEVMGAMEKLIVFPETYAIWFNVVQTWGRKPARINTVRSDV